MTQETTLVQRLISFLKKPSALVPEGDVHNPYDDYESSEEPDFARESEPPPSVLGRARLIETNAPSPNSASRLDTLMMRIVEQFRARGAYVIRCDTNDEMYYLTGRDANGSYIDPALAEPDRRAMFLALDSGESQLFVHHDNTGPVAVLCGPLWTESNEIIGVLYLDNPARSNLHRGVFEVFCEQVARMVASGAR
jgi:hypothetical protein